MKHFKSLLLATIFMLFACETEQIADKAIEESVLENTAIISAVNLELEIDEVDALFDEISLLVPFNDFITDKSALPQFSKTEDEDDEYRGFGNCVDLEFERGDNSFVFVLTYTGECEDRDGNPITGTITSTLAFNDNGFESTMTIENLTMNGYLINGTRSNIRAKSNENGNPEVSSSVNMTFESEEGKTTKIGEQTVELSEGADTPSREDDVRTITGFFDYRTPERSFSMQITTPLVKPSACDYIVSGVKTYTTEEGTSTLDFGDGTCDNLAILTLPDGSQEEITLRGRGRIGGSNEMQTKECTITTACEEVVIENTSQLSVEVTEENGVYTIIATNGEGEVVYEATCDKGSSVSVNCSSISNGEGEDEDSSDEGENDEEEDDNDEDDEDDEDEDDEDDNDDSFVGCILTTACGEVRFENESNLEVIVDEVNEIYVITVTNSEGEVVYEEECEMGAEASLECSAEDSSEG
jgi:hypothetical protein